MDKLKIGGEVREEKEKEGERTWKRKTMRRRKGWGGRSDEEGGMRDVGIGDGEKEQSERKEEEDRWEWG